MTYGSVCSGIEAATVAWHPLGWTPAFFAETDSFCRTLLKEHYPEVLNVGDFTEIDHTGPASIDLLVGGTPCQDFSVAGNRAGTEGVRGNLTLAFLGLVEAIRPQWVLWENVPGVLSIGKGRTFAAILATLGELGYGYAYRILDAQFVGGCPLHRDELGIGPVPQRRRRVFVVARLGDWRAPAQVLFEPQSLPGYPAPGRAARPEVAGTVGGSASQGGWGYDLDRTTFIPDVAYGLNAHPSRRYDAQTNETFVAGEIIAGPLMSGVTVRGHGTAGINDQAVDANHIVIPILEAGARTGTSTDDPRAGIGIGEPGDPMFTLQRGKQHAIAFKLAAAVRRLTPRECERLMGFPDDYTLITGYRKAQPLDLLDYYHRTERGRTLTEVRKDRLYATPDGPRYRVLGNSMAIPVMRWLGARIQEVT